MTRLLMVVLCVLVVAAGYGVTRAAADTFYGYTAPGTWFTPGAGYGSVYDNGCSRWKENDFSKGWNALGLITFIDSSGNWHNTMQGYGWIHRAPSPLDWTKKLHCKNNSGASYQGGCFGYRTSATCA